MLGHWFRVAHSLLREAHKIARSATWRAFRRSWLRTHWACIACGSLTMLQVHHLLPFADHPDLECDPGNVLTLCMAGLECHLRIGHGGSFDHYNPRAALDAAELARHPERRAQVEAAAKMRRVRI